MAEYLALATPFVIDRIMKSRRVEGVLFWILLDLTLLGVINLTQARLGILGWILAHVAYGLIWTYRRWRSQRVDVVAPALGLMVPVGAFLFFVAMFTWPPIRNRTIGGGSTSLSDDGRRQQFEMLWPKLLANPFGYGSAQSGNILQFRHQGGLLSVDSFIITLLLDYGIIGFFLFAGALFYCIWKLLQIAWHNFDGELSLALPLACTLLVVVQVRLVLSQMDNMPLIFLFLGMSAALIYRWTKDRETASKWKRHV